MSVIGKTRFGVTLAFALCFAGAVFNVAFTRDLFLMALIAMIAVWVVPWLGARGSSNGGAESTFTVTPRNDRWAEVRVTPAKGQPPLGGPLFFGAILAPVFGIGLLFGPLLYFMARDNYRRACHQGNTFAIGSEGILALGHRAVPWNHILYFVQRNPFLGSGIEQMISTGHAGGGVGAVGAAAALGTAVGHSMAGAANTAQQQNRLAFAPVGWMLDVVTVSGQRLPLAGGIREETVTALVHAIEAARPR